MRFFSLRLALGAVVVTGFLLVYGVVEMNESLRFRAPRVLTYEQFRQEKPQEGWFRITKGVLNVVDSAWEEDKTTHRIDKAFVPLFSRKVNSHVDKEEKTFVLLETRDESILDTVREAQSLSDDKSAEAFLKNNVNRVFPQRDIEGMIKTGLNEDSKTRTEMAKLDNSLEPNWVMLQENKHPSFGLGALMFLGGILLAVVQVLYYARRRMMR